MSQRGSFKYRPRNVLIAKDIMPYEASEEPEPAISPPIASARRIRRSNEIIDLSSDDEDNGNTEGSQEELRRLRKEVALLRKRAKVEDGVKLEDDMGSVSSQRKGKRKSQRVIELD